MLGDGVVYRGEADDDVLVVTALDTDVDHFRRVTARPRHGDRASTRSSCPTCRCRGRGHASSWRGLTDADVAALRYFRFIPQPVTVAGVDGCWVSRTGYSGELGYEVFCPPEGAERVWQGLLDAGAHSASVPTAWRRSSRCGSRPG